MNTIGFFRIQLNETAKNMCKTLAIQSLVRQFGCIYCCEERRQQIVNSKEQPNCRDCNLYKCIELIKNL